MPISSVWAGEKKNPSSLMPPDSPPLLYAATQGGVPYRLNLHDLDVGHTLLIGPTGAGKSVSLALFVAQWFRYLRHWLLSSAVLCVARILFASCRKNVQRAGEGTESEQVSHFVVIYRNGSVPSLRMSRYRR